MGTTINYSIAGKKTQNLNTMQKLGLTLGSMSLFLLLLTWLTGLTLSPNWLFLFLLLFVFSAGTVVYVIGTYKVLPAGIKNNCVYFNSLTNRGALGWIGAIILTLFYVCLYWYGDWFGDGTGVDGANEGTVALFDPLSQMMRGAPADKWFLYGTFYTIAILFLGIKFLYKYRKNKYHFLRTLAVMISQLGLAYILPYVLEGLNATSGGYYSLNPANS